MSGHETLLKFFFRTTVLTEFGDKTSVDVRRRVFDKADTRNFGALDFLQFMQVHLVKEMKEIFARPSFYSIVVLLDDL